jgi:hypothetical protein
MDMRHQTIPLICCALIGTAAVLAAPRAQAATSRIIYVAATNACQPATPLELGGLRFRPLGIYNNKPDSIYISCSLDTEFVGDQASSDIRIWFNNSTGTTKTVDCTAQGGSRQSGVNNYPGTVDVAAGTTTSLIFNDVDRVGTSYTTLNISCLLPNGVEMGTIRLQQESVADEL